jgi:hypothetical protein
MKQAYKLSMTKEVNQAGREVTELHIEFHLEVLDLGFKQWLLKSDKGFLFRQRSLIPMYLTRKWFVFWFIDSPVSNKDWDSSGIRAVNFWDLINVGSRIRFHSDAVALEFIAEFTNFITHRIDEELKQYKMQVGYGDYTLDDSSLFLVRLSLEEKEKLIDVLSKHIEIEASKTEQEAEKFEVTELIFNIRKRLVETTKFR